MKVNMPVTNNEVMFDEDDFMLTKTDLRGVITYANQDFIKTSGYSEAELLGSPHNLLRHPDMPEEAFADMWNNIKSGRPWSGIIKNRCKNGDFYWVSANVAPIFENQVVTGYLSVRRKPTSLQVSEASTAYRLFKDNKAQGLAIINGQVVRKSLGFKLKSQLMKLSVGQRLSSLVLIALLIALGLTGHGLFTLAQTQDRLKANFEQRMMPALDISKIYGLMLDNRTQLRIALSEVTIDTAAGKEPSLVLNHERAIKSADAIERNIEEITGIWKAYTAHTLPPDEKQLADKFAETRGRFVKEALKPAIVSLRANNYAETKAFSAKALELYAAAGPSLEALLKFQTDSAKREYTLSLERYEHSKLVSFGVLGAGLFIIFWLGFIVVRSLTKPLETAVDVFDRITSNKLDSPIEANGEDEVSKVLRRLKITQTMLGVNENQARELDRFVKGQNAEYENQLQAISNSTGVMEFSMDGIVLNANDNLLKVMGYSKAEIVGQNHSNSVDPAYRNSAEYQEFWAKLKRGESISGEFQRFYKDGKEVWIQASYNSIIGACGNPYKVIKYASDITELKLKNADYEGQIIAIGKSQGVIEIGLDGTALKVNEVYLNMVGYTEKEMLGKSVSMVLPPNFMNTEAYKTLWDKLMKGGTDSGQYKRIHKSGKEVWIQAAYNPIFDLHGKVHKIVNYTMDITEQKLIAADNAGQLAAIDKTQGVIEFDTTGKILAVNENFAKVVGYTEAELIGKHHSMFVEAAYRASPEYKQFWERLAKGESFSDQFIRVAKSGELVCLQASYNAIMDINGKPFKVVKYATDITESKAAAALKTAVDETQTIIESTKTGDLSNRVSLEGKVGAIASLCDGVNALMDQMTEVIVQVRESSETINTAAGEIASGNNDLSSRTEQQASSLEETAASMEELASTVKNNAENAKQANQLAIAASGIALKGGKVVSEVVTTMSAINSSAKKIEDIISVIDGIAFQTNILALNAAVEAARAGEQGRGFAVVAGEVRNLAQRSASAAKEIKELITDSVSKTAEGTKQVETAGNTMQEIVSSVQRVTDIMGEITAASVEQSAGIDQVNQAITSMDEVTQQNAALVEQAAAAAESLVEQSVSLTETVSAFRLNGVQGTPKAKASNSSSNSRAVASRPATRMTSSKPAAKKPVTTGGNNDGDWEEF